MRLRSNRFVCALLAGMVLVGCGGGGSTGTSEDKPTYRLINASADTPALDFFLDNDKAGDSIPYGGSTGDFKSIKADLHDIVLHPVGAAEDAWAEAYNFRNGQDLAIVAFGLSSFGEEYYKRLRLANILINRSRPNGNRSRLYVVNSFNRLPGFDNVSVDFKNPGDNPQYALRDIGVGGFSEFELDSGTQTFELRLSGAEQVFATKDLTFGAGKIYVVLLCGIEEATGAQAPDIKLVELQPNN